MIKRKRLIHPILQIIFVQIASTSMHLMNSVPQAAETTFAFSSVCILLLWFRYLVEKCNETLVDDSMKKVVFIGVLDIAGFEIFDVSTVHYSFKKIFPQIVSKLNSWERCYINKTKKISSMTRKTKSSCFLVKNTVVCPNLMRIRRKNSISN